MPNPLDYLRNLIVGELPKPRQPYTLIDGRPEWLDDMQPYPGQSPDPQGPPVRIDDPSGKLTGKYDRNVMYDVASKAKMAGVDPLTALAMAGQETTFGRYGAGPDNPLHLLHHPDEQRFGPFNPAGDTLAALDYYKKRTDRQRAKTPDDEELIIQSYNGLGKIQGGSEIGKGVKMYGGQPSLHGAKDRPYGKAIIKLRELLANQPDIQGLLK